HHLAQPRPGWWGGDGYLEPCKKRNSGYQRLSVEQSERCGTTQRRDRERHFRDHSHHHRPDRNHVTDDYGVYRRHSRERNCSCAVAANSFQNLGSLSSETHACPSIPKLAASVV